LIAQKRPYRLLVLQALQWAIVRDDHAKAYGVDAKSLDATRAAILAKAGTSAKIIHLEASGLGDDAWTPAQRIAAYRKANQWMADRAEHVLVHLNDGHKALPGGTGEALKLFKKDETKIHRV
jgi:hypothetical protein